MSNQNKIIVISITTVVTVGAVLFMTTLSKKRKTAIQRQEIADEGYETAYDILYPLKSYQQRYKYR